MSETEVKQEFLEALSSLSDAVPMRMGQLLAAIGEVCSDLHGRGLWNAEDRELLEATWKFRQDVESSMPAKAHPDA